MPTKLDGQRISDKQLKILDKLLRGPYSTMMQTDSFRDRIWGALLDLRDLRKTHSNLLEVMAMYDMEDR